jgi:uncharacterized membrane protein
MAGNLSCDDMNQRNYCNVLFISLSMFGLAFFFNFVMVLIPFFIHNISLLSSQETLIWAGLIMGATSFAAALASPFGTTFETRYA